MPASKERKMNGNGSDNTIGNRVAGALDGYDDPDRGPIDRAENVLEGRDDPNRGPLDRVANLATGSSGGVAAATQSSSDAYVSDQAGVISAVFDTDDEAREAVDELRA